MAPPPDLRSIDQILSLADNGDYHPGLLDRIAAAILETSDFGQAYRTKGKCKIALGIELSLDQFGQIELTVEDKITLPKQPKAKGIAWATTEGRLTPHNPAQTRMEIRETNPGQRELRAATD